MMRSDRGQLIHKQFQHLNLKLEESLEHYKQSSSELEQHRFLFGISIYRVLIYLNHIQKYFWLKSRGYKHEQIRHLLNPF